MTPPRKHGQFGTTRWSMVLAAGGDRTSPDAQAALAVLCDTYWYPLYAFLRSRGHSAADAEDVTQAFFARLLEKHTLRHADRERGRFRSFLLSSLTHFAANEHDKDAAQKRGGGVPALSIEFENAEGRFKLEPSTNETPEKVFDRRWAITLLDRVLSRLKAEMVGEGNAPQFEHLKTYLVGDLPRVSYSDSAEMLGMSEGAVKVAVHRLRKRYRDLVREEIMQTVSSAAEVEDELRHLLASVST